MAAVGYTFVLDIFIVAKKRRMKYNCITFIKKKMKYDCITENSDYASIKQNSVIN